MTYFQSSRLPSGVPILIGALDKLVKRRVDILDDEGTPTGETRSKLQGYSIDIISDILGLNMSIVNVMADEDVLA